MATVIQDAPEIYHGTKALSNSGMGKLLKCPAKFKHWMDKGDESKADYFTCGSLLHAMVLEPEAVASRYAIQQFSGATKVGKEESANAKEKGITLIKADMWNACAEMAVQIFEHPLIRAAKLAEDWQTETSIYWKDHGVPCKARIDALATIPGVGLCAIDLKTTQDASPDSISKSMANYGYHRQAAWYRRALNAAGYNSAAFVLVFVEKEAPYCVTAATVSEAAQGDALEDIKTALELYTQCTESGVWPGYTDPKHPLIELDLPKWAQRS